MLAACTPNRNNKLCFPFTFIIRKHESEQIGHFFQEFFASHSILKRNSTLPVPSQSLASYGQYNMDLAGNRTSNTRSASIGRPCLNPNDMTLTVKPTLLSAENSEAIFSCNSRSFSWEVLKINWALPFQFVQKFPFHFNAFQWPA